MNRVSSSCDGCQRGLPISPGGIHRDAAGKPFMFCIEAIYQAYSVASQLRFGEAETKTGRCPWVSPENRRCDGEQGHLGFHWHWAEE